jgi:molybdopterin-guanine dinucleotide biosynthesis protein A
MIAGAVLCGGRSSRMGSDKALIPVEGVPMARRVADALRAGGCDIVEAIGGDRDALVRIGFDVIDDPRQGEGPLAGVLAALEAWPTADAVVVVACDLPYLGGGTVAALLAALRSDDQVVAAVGTTDRIQPLCVAWRPSASSPIAAAMAAGERSVHAVLAQLPTMDVSVNRQDVTNVNVPADLPD